MSYFPKGEKLHFHAPIGAFVKKKHRPYNEPYFHILNENIQGVPVIITQSAVINLMNWWGNNYGTPCLYVYAFMCLAMWKGFEKKSEMAPFEIWLLISSFLQECHYLETETKKRIIGKKWNTILRWECNSTNDFVRTSTWQLAHIKKICN